MAIANAPSAPILTADGIPLRVSLRRSMRRSKLRALALVLPAFLFLVIVFILPIGNLLTRSVDDALINHQLPLTFSLIETWDRDQQSLPEEALFESVYLDLTTINKFLIANNTGASVDVSNAAWWLKIPPKGPYKESIVQINPRWGEAGAWQPLKQLVDKSLAHRGTEKEKRNVKQRAAFDLCSELTPLNNASCRTLFKALETWDGQSAPDESLFAALYKDLNSAQKILSGKSSTRMNYEEPGWKGIIRTSLRKFKTIEGPPYRDAMIKANKGWGEVRFWQSLVLMKDARTMGYYLNAFDRRYDVDKNIILRSEERRVYVMLWWRTLILSLIVTVGCLVLSYPVAHLLATLPLRYSNLLMICVLMPFWTSLLVRIVSWMVMLQQEGVINDALVWTRLISDENRLPMMYNFTGTVIVMIQILLPFMILPIYSVMKTIPPSYMRAAQNLGAAPSLAFLRVYMPLTLPGVGAGVILVFIVAIGYYITPELVGGKDGRLIGNMIAYHMQKSLNWGLGAAMGTVLLAAILVLYWVYDKIVGVDNLKMG
jgi:putative spermidine/putrescine transport system permease protein